MDKFAALEPVKLYAPSQASGSLSGSRFLSKANASAKVPVNLQLLIGRLPVDIHILILSYIALTDVPAYALCCRATAGAARDERVWEARWRLFVNRGEDFEEVLDILETQAKEREKKTVEEREKNKTVDIGGGDDDFGDFTSSTASGPKSLSNFDSLSLSLSLHPAVLSKSSSSPVSLNKYKRAHKLLKPHLHSLNLAPHLILEALFPPTLSSLPSDASKLDSKSSPSPKLSPKSITYQSHLLTLLTTYLTLIQPLRNWEVPYLSLRSAIDRYDANLLSLFDDAERRADEAKMAEIARASWEVYGGSVRSGGRGMGMAGAGIAGEWETGRVWAEKKEVFYEMQSGKWKPLENFTSNNTLDFTPFTNFISHLLTCLERDGRVATRVFPPESGVLLAYVGRVAGEVVSEYLHPLLTHARQISNHIFLQATAASFKESWRLVDAVIKLSEDTYQMQVLKAHTGDKGKKRRDVRRHATVEQAEDIIFKTFEPHMDEYLDEEIESVRNTLAGICREWEAKISKYTTNPSSSPLPPSSLGSSAAQPTRFLTSQNPAQMKRTLLASFTDVLLLPVTIVPRAVGAVNAVGAAITTGFTAGLSSASGGMGMSGVNGRRGMTNGSNAPNGGYSGFRNLDDADGVVFEIGPDQEDEKGDDADITDIQKEEEKDAGLGFRLGDVKEERWDTAENDVASIDTGKASSHVTTASLSTNATSLSASSRSPKPSPLLTPTQSGSPYPSSSSPKPGAVTPTLASQSLPNLDLLLSLDTALDLIHTDRESLKRVETFAFYPGHYGHRVRETIEEVFVELLKAMGEHLGRGFEVATSQMHTYKPAEHEETTSVAPLLQFFELVHVGDTIQSMVQVYFDKDLVPHIDRTDFLNTVVREKKRFENALDDSVAAGLNAGTEVLMNQVEHIILIQTPPRLYYPPDDAPLDLGPTKGCKNAIACLEMHCKLLKGSTSKEVLEVFYKEVGIRLIAVLHKHLKRQIISLTGGFQVIADLNAYHAFISSLKVPSIQSDFAHLKMLGHVYVVEDAKDLAQIVRDVTRYGGSYRPEDIYEFIQRRADWKKIEKTVDKTMYNLSFKEDCIIC